MQHTVNRQQCIEFGQVATLAAIAAALYTHDFLYVQLSLPVLLITLLQPGWLYPLAWIWLGAAKLLGVVNIHILLTLVFIVVVVPVGLWRKLRGRDTLQLQQFKKDNTTVMVVRNHVYTKSDLQHTF